MKTRALFCAFAVLLVAAGLQAQETTTGSIEGTVRDAQGAAIPGATVTVTSDQGVKNYVTDENGHFFAAYLTPGTYTVRVELSGFRPVEQANVGVVLGRRTDLNNLVLTVGGITETVTVTGTAPTVDTSRSSVGGVLDAESLKRLPVGRQFTDTLYLVPGVTTGGTIGAANPSISGASGLENQYIVDGVNITNAGYGAVGSYSIVFGSLGAGVTTDFIRETQVKTAGFEAEYGEATGGVVNVITNSGSNDFRGAVFGYWRPDFLEGNFTTVTTQNGTVNTTGTNNADVGASLGGPIVRDKLFFFGVFNPQWQNRTFVAPPDFPLASLGEVNRRRRTFGYAGKLSWAGTANHRLDFSAFGDPARGFMGPQRLTSLLRANTTAFSSIDFGGHNQVLNYNGILSPNWLIEGLVAHATNNITELPSVNEWNVVNRTVSPNLRTGGIGFFEVGNDSRNWQFQLKSTNLFNAAGHHQIRYGALHQRISYDNIINRTGPAFTLPNGEQSATGAEIEILPDPEFGQIFRVVRANTTNVRNTNQRYWSFFLQDTWEIGRFTLRPGVRYEQQRLFGNLADFSWDGNWAPRMGVVWDPLGNGKGKVFANFGRFYAKIPNDLAARALSADAGVTRADYFDPQLTRPVPEGTLAAGSTVHFGQAGLAPAVIDPGSRSTFQQEFLGGVEWELARNFTGGVRYIHRTMPRILEDVGTAAMALYFTNPEDLGSVEYFITNPANGTPATFLGVGSFEDAVHRYDAVEFTFNKLLHDNWSVVASYRWSRLRGNFEGFYRNDNGQSDPAITSLFDFPTNDPTYTTIGRELGFRGDIRFLGTAGIGPLPTDRTHQVKVYGTYTWRGLGLGAAFNAGSGRPLTPLAANPVYNSPGEIPEAPRGSGIQTVDGFRERTPFEYSVDAHADLGVHVGGRRVLLIADVFNVLDTQRPIRYDEWTETGFTVLNPDFGRVLEYQAPRQVRLGARVEF
jgi:hypothetical protein